MPRDRDAPRPRVVIDTNVYVSGLNYRGAPREALELMRHGVIEVVISPFILEEIERVLARTFAWEKVRIEQVIRLIRARTTLVEPTEHVSIITAKESDNRILECAVEGQVQYLVTGDKQHILPLGEYEGIRILSPADFLGLL